MFCSPKDLVSSFAYGNRGIRTGHVVLHTWSVLWGRRGTLYPRERVIVICSSSSSNNRLYCRRNTSGQSTIYCPRFCEFSRFPVWQKNLIDQDTYVCPNFNLWKHHSYRYSFLWLTSYICLTMSNCFHVLISVFLFSDISPDRRYISFSRI